MQPHLNTGVEKSFIISLALTIFILVVEVGGGLWTGSLALLSDSAHVFMDIFALGLSYLALRLSALPADDRHTYGYHRLEVLAALVNGASLGIIALGIWWEAIQRWQQPQHIRSGEMLVIAILGLVVNVVVAFVLGGHSHEQERGNKPVRQDLNLHSAFLHVIGDAVSSIGVILAAVIITLTGLEWVDPLVSVLIGALILFNGYRVLRSSLHILIEGVPEGMSIQQVGTMMGQVTGVHSVHDLHIWSICSGHIALSAHIVLAADDKQGAPLPVMAQLQQQLLEKFGIEHTTIQIDADDCPQAEGSCGA
jgi:cobalt-zinc-cadmium efflux system protein